MTIFTDASLNTGLGGFSTDGRWYKAKWSDIKLYDAWNRYIVWKELVPISAFIDSIELSITKQNSSYLHR